MNKQDKERIKDLIKRLQNKIANVKEESEFKEEFVVAKRVVYTEMIKELKKVIKNE